MKEATDKSALELIADVVKGALGAASNAAVAISGAVVACAYQERGMMAIGGGAIGAIMVGIGYRYWRKRRR